MAAISMSPVDASTTAASPRPRVLVADDNAVLRRLVGLSLWEAGFQVVEAPDGTTALELATTGRFSVVLLDSHMPGLTGPEVITRLRQAAPTATLPVILVTAAASVGDRVAGLAAGADDYVTKPFDLEEVVARVQAQHRAHEAWTAVVAASARQRGVLARAVAVAGRQETIHAMAKVVCHALIGQEEVASAALVRFTADGLAIPVACTGRPLWGLSAGDPVPPPLRRYLHARAAAGPWMENGPAARVIAGPALITGSVACAPLRDEDALHGVLLVALDDEAVAWVDPSAALSAAIDAAGIVHGLLRSRFTDLRGSEVGRSELRTVLREQAFTPHFQPIVRLADGHVAGVEALTRFTDGSNPETRFREAALLGLGPDLELATLTAALDAARRRLDTGLWLSLNVSPAFVTSGDRRLTDVLDLRGHEVVLELSEQEIVADYDAVRAAVSAAGGLRLSVDDAGSGFASLRHILRLEPAFVKLDRSWVHHVDTDPARQAMIAGLRHFADSTGAELIAEGIERPEERDVLIDLRVDYGQGYLLGRPAALTA